MIKHKRFSHSWSRLFCGLAFCAQIILPFAHEWQVAEEEAAYHSLTIEKTSNPLLYTPQKSEHHHHGAGTCDLCRVLNRTRETLTGGFTGLSSPQKTLSPFFSVETVSTDESFLLSNPTRGPPLFLTVS